MKLSIVIPVLNEEAHIEKLAHKVKESLNNKIEYEVLWVDDGSDDRTSELIKEIAEKDRDYN